jgi:hypothetical protein
VGLLTRSGVLNVMHAPLHVVIAAKHCFRRSTGWCGPTQTPRCPGGGQEEDAIEGTITIDSLHTGCPESKIYHAAWKLGEFQEQSNNRQMRTTILNEPIL